MIDGCQDGEFVTKFGARLLLTTFLSGRWMLIHDKQFGTLAVLHIDDGQLRCVVHADTEGVVPVLFLADTDCACTMDRCAARHGQ